MMTDVPKNRVIFGGYDELKVYKPGETTVILENKDQNMTQFEINIDNIILMGEVISDSRPLTAVFDVNSDSI